MNTDEMRADARLSGTAEMLVEPARILAMLDVVDAARKMVAAEESDADSYWEALEAGKAALAKLDAAP